MRGEPSRAIGARRKFLTLMLLVLFTDSLRADLPQESPEFHDAMDLADSLVLERDYKGALKILRQADRLSDGQNYECKMAMARTFNEIGAFKNAKECSRRAQELADGDFEIAAALHQLALAHFARGEAGNEDLKVAIDTSQQVIDLVPEQANIARFMQGIAYLKLGQDQKGVELLETFLSLEPEGSEADVARTLVANPMRARVALMPDFEIVTLQGEYLTSEDVLGKVVLVDFWGTWCAPCVQAVPHLRGLGRRTSNRPFVLLSVSNDDDQRALRAFISDHQMTWPQFHDKTRELNRAFGVETYPTYVLVDAEGKIVFRRSGWSDRIGAELSREVGRHLRAARKRKE